MTYFPRFSRVLRGLCVAIFLLVAVSPMWATGSSTVVISQVYGGGGNTGATYNADFVELFNLGTTSVSLAGYAIQYGSSTGTTISATIPITGSPTLAPGEYYLIAASAGTVGAALPTVDLTISSSTLAFGGSAGRVYLTNSILTLASSCPGSGGAVVDFVGYGTGTTCYEGTAFAPTPSATLADIRNSSCTDTDQNGTDFKAVVPAPRNSATTFAPCSGGSSSTPSALALTASATPNLVGLGANTLLTAVVTPGTLPASTGITVTADTSALGGTPTQTLYDDGTHGDITANDGTYSYQLTIPQQQASNSYIINFKAADTQLRSATGSTTITVHTTSPDFVFNLGNTGIIVSGTSPRGTTTANVSMINTFNSPVSLSCAGLPSNARCIFSPTTLAASGSSTLEIVIDGAKAASRKPVTFSRSNGITLAFTLLGLPFLLRRKLRKHLGGVVTGMLLLGLVLSSLTGCGSSSAPVGTSTVTVTATGGSITHTATFTLNVQ